MILLYAHKSDLKIKKKLESMQKQCQFHKNVMYGKSRVWLVKQCKLGNPLISTKNIKRRLNSIYPNSNYIEKRAEY